MIEDARLAQANPAYRAAGLPGSADDLAPDPPVSDEENFMALFREVQGEIGRGVGASPSAVETFARADDRPRLDLGRDRNLGRDLLHPECAGVKGA